MANWSPCSKPTTGYASAPSRFPTRLLHEAVGYRIDYRDRSVVLSGDTGKSANLINHARGVDLLLHEALASRMTERIAQAADSVNVAGPAKIMRDVPSYHATPVEAAESAAEAGAAQLLLYHIIPPLPISALEQVFLDGVADAYDGPVTLGTDGTLISLPASWESVEFVAPAANPTESDGGLGWGERRRPDGRRVLWR